MPNAAALNETGTRAGDFIKSPVQRFIEWELIGQGGSAEVYKVKDQELGIPLAIKILKQVHREDQRYTESLRREVLISRKLRHPHICPIHDLYEGERGVGIVMDLIEGHDLKQWLREQRGHLLETISSRVRLLYQLAEALAVAHSLIIHRDLKPANIFLIKGNIAKPIIMDFGLSTPDGMQGTEMLDGGTPKYMAPEQFLRSAEIDHRADLYALGILAYEVLTDGNIPACSLKDAYKTGTLPVFEPFDILPPSAFCAAIPAELDRLILQLMDHDPAKRPSTASEVSNVLKDVKLLDPFRPMVRTDQAVETITIGGGTYTVGDKSTSRSCDGPARKVNLKKFRIAMSPVTNADYRRFLAATGYKAPALFEHPQFGGATHPVVMVSWHDATAYAQWAGGRLPTEFEWEVAAKGGAAELDFPWGSEVPKITQANIDNICTSTTPVGSYPAGNNTLGLMDCCGNVWEWCADIWDDSLLRSPVSEMSAAVRQMRPLRGGSFDSPIFAGKTTFRHRMYPDAMRADVGFRIVYDA